MAGYSSAVICGNLVRDPELKYTRDNKPFAKGTVVFDHPFKKDQPTFLEFVLWGKRAETYVDRLGLQKGDRTLLHGRLSMDSWEDKNTGAKRTKVVLEADDFSLVHNRRDDGARSEPGKKTYDESSFTDNPFDAEGVQDVPF